MTNYLIYVIIILGSLSGYLSVRNISLREEISYQEASLASMESSLLRAKEIFEIKLASIEERSVSQKSVKQGIGKRKEQCDGDEKAQSIIAIGIPQCLRY